MIKVRYFVGGLTMVFLLVIIVFAQFGQLQAQNDNEQRVPQTATQIQLSFAPLVKKSAPAVVNIYAERRVRSRSPFAGDPFFEQFFGRQRGQSSRLQSSLGSGVIVENNGLIVTNYHVIRDAEAIKVALSDGREFASHLILEDEATDIAVLQIDAIDEQFPILPLGDSDTVEVGDLVLAIGNPFGVGQTVTSGIVSAQSRSRVGLTENDFFIQTDAAINPGNSGGALVDMKGELIGINTAIYSRSGGSIGIGFAIPSNLVRAIVIAAKHGKVYFEQPYFGASVQYVTIDIAKSLGLDVPYGALVADITPQSPAAKAGLEIGDVIISAQGARIDNPDALGYRLLTAGLNETIKLEVLREGEIQIKEVALSRRDETLATTSETIEGHSPLAGAQVANINSDNRRRLALAASANGVVVIGLERGSPAATIFQTGDIIHAVNGREVRNITVLKQTLAEARGYDWQVEYERGGIVIRQFLR